MSETRVRSLCHSPIGALLSRLTQLCHSPIGALLSGLEPTSFHNSLLITSGEVASILSNLCFLMYPTTPLGIKTRLRGMSARFSIPEKLFSMGKKKNRLTAIQTMCSSAHRFGTWWDFCWWPPSIVCIVWASPSGCVCDLDVACRPG